MNQPQPPPPPQETSNNHLAGWAIVGLVAVGVFMLARSRAKVSSDEENAERLERALILEEANREAELAARLDADLLERGHF